MFSLKTTSYLPEPHTATFSASSCTDTARLTACLSVKSVRGNEQFCGCRVGYYGVYAPTKLFVSETCQW